MNIELESVYQGADLEAGQRMIKRIFKLSIPIYLIVITIPMLIYLIYSYVTTGNRPSLFLSILCLVLLGLMIYFLLYSLQNRPALIASLMRLRNSNGEVYTLTEDNITIRGAGEENTVADRFQASHLLGQFWYLDYYGMYLKDKEKRRFLLIKITPDNVDDINSVIRFYHSRKKYLIKLKA